jgi:hypothetical protein
MKTPLKLIFFVLAAATFVSTQCKAQQTSSRASKLIDSLHITNSDEIKICDLYDEVITDYMNEMKQWSAGNSKANTAEANAIGKKYQQKVKDIQPQINNFKKTIQGNYQEAMKFAQFCSLEAQRWFGIMSQYQKGMMPSGYGGYGGAPSGH